MVRKKFLRQNWFLKKKLGMKWRRPRGKQSKTRKSMKSRLSKPLVGYEKTNEKKYLIREYVPILIHNATELSKIVDKNKQAAVIASGVGLKNTLIITDHAGKHGIKILNMKKVRLAEQKQLMFKKKKDVLAGQEKKDEKKIETEKKQPENTEQIVRTDEEKLVESKEQPKEKKKKKPKNNIDNETADFIESV